MDLIFPFAKFAGSVTECRFRTKPLTARGVQFYGEEEMKMQQKLRQVCAELKISRRTIQGYEKAGLVAPSGKNKYGHLLYGETEQERIRLIRFYQLLGFQLRCQSGKQLFSERRKNWNLNISVCRNLSGR